MTDRHWAWAGAVLLGLGFTMWMVIEISMLGSPWDTANAGEAAMTWVLYGIYVTVAVLLLILPQLSRVREYLDRSALE
jgi:hypothetical protein